MLGTLTRKQIDAVLRAATIGRIGVSADGRTYVVPVTYVYDGGAVYGHTTVGQKVRMMRTKLIAARLGPLTASETAGPSGKTRGKIPVSYRIHLSERTGRFERRAAKRHTGGRHG